MFFAGYKANAVKLVFAALLYGFGVIALTAQVNVPMNDALAQLAGPLDQPVRVWVEYSSQWTNWNMVRTILSGVAMLLSISALPPRAQYQKR